MPVITTEAGGLTTGRSCERPYQATRVSRTRRRIATPRLMGAVYGEILKATEAAGFAPPRHRVSLSRGKLLSLLLRVGFG